MKKLCLIDVDVQSAIQFSEVSGMDPMMLAVLPESIEAFENEVRGNLHETEESVKKLLNYASRDMEACNEEGLFDYVVTESSPDSAETVRDILSKHRPDVAPPRAKSSDSNIKKPFFVCCDNVLDDCVDKAIASIIELSKGMLKPLQLTTAKSEEGEEGMDISELATLIENGECIEFTSDEDGKC